MIREIKTKFRPPSTAGKIITESEIRVASSCLRKYKLGVKEIEWDNRTLAIRDSYVATYNQLMRRAKTNERFWKTRNYQHYFKKHGVWKEGSFNECEESHKLLLRAAELEALFRKSVYTPAYPSDIHRVRVGKTLIELHVDCIFHRESDDSLHMLDFSPYQRQLLQKNDPTLPLKVKLLEATFKRYPRDIYIHSVGWGPTMNRSYFYYKNTKLTEEDFYRSFSLIQAIEAGMGWATNPCPNLDCEVLKKCTIKGK